MCTLKCSCGNKDFFEKKIKHDVFQQQFTGRPTCPVNSSVPYELKTNHEKSKVIDMAIPFVITSCRLQLADVVMKLLFVTQKI